MKKEKMNDKGFSLVELIIVIAIMAVLVVVLAPQYLKYVERARNSTDTSNATSIVTALQVYAADPDVEEPFTAEESFTITVSKTGTTFGTGGNNRVAGDALDSAAISTEDLKCKSKSKWTQYVISGTVNKNGEIKFTYSPQEFSDSMTGGSSASASTSPTGN